MGEAIDKAIDGLKSEQGYRVLKAVLNSKKEQYGNFLSRLKLNSRLALLDSLQPIDALFVLLIGEGDTNLKSYKHLVLHRLINISRPTKDGFWTLPTFRCDSDEESAELISETIDALKQSSQFDEYRVLFSLMSRYYDAETFRNAVYDGEFCYHGQVDFKPKHALQAIQSLLEMGVVDLKNGQGRIALHQAMQLHTYGDTDDPNIVKLLELLIEHGADININQRNDNGETPLDLAQQCRPRVEELLMHYGAKTGQALSEAEEVQQASDEAHTQEIPSLKFIHTRGIRFLSAAEMETREEENKNPFGLSIDNNDEEWNFRL